MAGSKRTKHSPAATRSSAGTAATQRARPSAGKLRLGTPAVAGVIAAVFVGWFFMPAKEVQVPKDGAGCWPLNGSGGTSAWMAHGERRVNLEALPSQARAFACYDGRASVAAEGASSPAVLRDSAVVLIEDFLTDAEIQHFRSLIRRHAKPTPQPGYHFAFAAGGQYDEVYGQEPDRLVDLKQDSILNQLEKRIADVLDVPAHADESHLQLSLDTGVGAAGAAPNFHHDKNHGLVRYATALIYLTTPEEGGETIFPALPFSPGGPSARTPELTRYVEEFKQIVSARITKNRKLTPSSPWPDVQVTEGSKLHRELSALCPGGGRDVQNAGSASKSLAVRPVRGRAIIFWHEVVGGSDPLLDMFHAGCPVKRGEKLSLQKFKNFAPGSRRCEFSKWCKHYF